MTHSQEYCNGWNDGVKRGRELLALELQQTGGVMVDFTIPDIDNKLKEKLFEFLKYRRSIKKPIRPASYKAFQIKLEKLSECNVDTACEILEESIANGWQGIFPLKNSTSSSTKVGKARV